MLRLCIEKGMVSGRRQEVDSAFVKAGASLNSLAEREMEEERGDQVENLVGEIREELFYKKIFIEDIFILKHFGS
jgi:hypothetical protein